MMWYGGYGQHMSGGGYVLLGLGTLLFWSALILGIVALLRHLGRANGSASSNGADTTFTRTPYAACSRAAC